MYEIIYKYMYKYSEFAIFIHTIPSYFSQFVVDIAEIKVHLGEISFANQTVV